MPISACAQAVLARIMQAALKKEATALGQIMIDGKRPEKISDSSSP
jgi:hypothetical protein